MILFLKSAREKLIWKENTVDSVLVKLFIVFGMI